MYSLNDNESERLLQILQGIIHDKEEFEQMVEKVLQLKHQIPEITTEDQFWEYDGQIKRMLQHYTMLLSLLIDLRRQDRISFHQGKQTTDFLNLYLIVKNLQERIEALHQFLTKSHDYGEVYDLSRQLQHNFTIFMKSEEKTIQEIERELGSGISISQEKILEVKEGKLKVEIHRGVCIALFADNYTGKRSYPFGLQIFDHDYLVAEAGIVEFTVHGKLVVTLTQAYIRKRAYLQRTVELLLRRGIISEWWSDTSLSHAAGDMYQRIKSKDQLEVQFRENRYVVTLKK